MTLHEPMLELALQRQSDLRALARPQPFVRFATIDLASLRKRSGSLSSPFARWRSRSYREIRREAEATTT